MKDVPANPLNPTRRAFLKTACAAGVTLFAAQTSGMVFPLFASAGTGLSTEQRTALFMGTIVTLTAATKDPARAQAAFEKAFTEIQRLIAVFDRHSGSSVLGTLNAQNSIKDAPAEFLTVLAKARALEIATAGVFNPAVAPVVDLMAQGSADSNTLKETLLLSKPGAVHISDNTVRLERSGMSLTLDGIAKGFIADSAAAILERQGIQDYMVDAGGDIRLGGNNAAGVPWTVGIRHPSIPDAVLTTISAFDGAVATSGSYEKAFNAKGTKHHIVNPFTGNSPETTSVTVRAPSAMEADALATALALMPPADALKFMAQQKQSACLIIDRAGRVYTSPNWG